MPRPAPKPQEKEPKPKSEAALRRDAINKEVRERADVIRELTHFKRQCAVCVHDKAYHVLEDERWVCTLCTDSYVREHIFLSVLKRAVRFFRTVDRERAAAGLTNPLDTAPSGVLYYRERPQPPAGGTPMTSTARRRSVPDEDEPTPAPKRSASRATPPPAPASAKSGRSASKSAQNGAASDGENECLCGCGGATKSRFRPGHDATLKSRLINEALDPKAKASVRARAERELEKLGWTELLEKSRDARQARADKPRTAKGERSAAQVAATERMRAASKAKGKAKAAEVDEDDDEVDEDDDDE